MNATIILANLDGTEGIRLEGTGYAVRCATHIAHENLPDARWALEVLNRYGHLVTHDADREAGPLTRIERIGAADLALDAALRNVAHAIGLLQFRDGKAIVQQAQDFVTTARMAIGDFSVITSAFEKSVRDVSEVA